MDYLKKLYLIWITSTVKGNKKVKKRRVEILQKICIANTLKPAQYALRRSSCMVPRSCGPNATRAVWYNRISKFQTVCDLGPFM